MNIGLYYKNRFTLYIPFIAYSFGGYNLFVNDLHTSTSIFATAAVYSTYKSILTYSLLEILSPKPVMNMFH